MLSFKVGVRVRAKVKELYLPSLPGLTLLGGEHVVLGEGMYCLVAQRVSLYRHLEALGSQRSIIRRFIDVALQQVCGTGGLGGR